MSATTNTPRPARSSNGFENRRADEAGLARLPTQQEVADRFHVTRHAVSKVERQALRKLKRACEAEAALAGMNLRTWLFGDHE